MDGFDTYVHKFSDLFVERYLSAGKPGEIIFNYSFFESRVLV